MTAVGLVSVGIVLVLLLGEIDLSVGAVSGLCAAIMAVLAEQKGWSPYLAIAAGVAAGTPIGLFQGTIFTRFGIPSFVVTLAGLLAWPGRPARGAGRDGDGQHHRLQDHRPDEHLLQRRRRVDPRRWWPSPRYAAFR